MNKSFIKFITDFGPLLVFLSFYYRSEKNLTVAIPPFIVATLVALIVVWILEKKIPMVPLLGGIFITLFGGLTIYFDNPVAIGEHPQHIAELDKLNDQLANAEEKLITLRKHFNNTQI